MVPVLGAAGDLKELWTLDHGPMPVEAWSRALEAADGDDDRVWLGRANQAISTGHFEDAARWLDRCAARRCEDTAVWRARLNLALATGDAAGFWKAVRHLPVDKFDAATILSLRAWLMALRHDEAGEERELRAIFAVDPGNTKALERLAALMVQPGRVSESEELHRRKAELDRTHDKYQSMLKGDDLPSHAAELAELAATLGLRVRQPSMVDPGRSPPARPRAGGAWLRRGEAVSPAWSIGRQGRSCSRRRTRAPERAPANLRNDTR